MSQMMSILDEQGNINADQLSKEIKASLEYDIRYRQVDNMKKRAIRTSTNYEEFQALVACAHLKKLTKKEVESLTQVKQGWKKAPTSKAEKASILEYEMEHEQLQQLNSKGIAVPAKLKQDKKKKVKSMLELERDLRRISGDSEKWRYLEELGQRKTLNLLQSGTEIDLMEEIVRIISVRAVSTNESVQLSNAPPSSKEDDVPTETAESSSISEKSELQILCEWLEGISKLEKFSLFKQFASKTLLQQVHDVLALHMNYISTETLAQYSSQ